MNQFVIHIKGDIMHTPKTAKTLLSRDELSNNSASFIDDRVAKWDNHKEGGKYIIGYTISDKMDSHSKKLIPQVFFDIY